jgi:hypothetical protein
VKANCTNCHAPIPSENVNVDEGMAICKDCGELLWLDTLADRATISAAKGKPPSGSRIHMERDEDHALTITIMPRPIGARTICLGLFAAFWNGLMALLLINIPAKDIGFGILATSPLTLIGLTLLGILSRRLWGKTVVIVNCNDLRITRILGPLERNRIHTTADITGFTAKLVAKSFTVTADSPRQSDLTYRFNVTLKRGKATLHDELRIEEALWLANGIGEFLDALKHVWPESMQRRRRLREKPETTKATCQHCGASLLPENTTMSEGTATCEICGKTSQLRPLLEKHTSRPAKVDKPPTTRVTLHRAASQRLEAIIRRDRPNRQIITNVAINAVWNLLVWIGLVRAAMTGDTGTVIVLTLFVAMGAVMGTRQLLADFGATSIVMDTTTLTIARKLGRLKTSRSHPIADITSITRKETPSKKGPPTSDICVIFETNGILIGSTLTKEEQDWLTWELYDFWKAIV